MKSELVQRFDSLSDWHQWLAGAPGQRNPAVIEAMAASVRASGLVEPLTHARYTCGDISSRGNNHRESLRAGKLISRQRAVCLALTHLAEDQARKLDRRSRIYSTEALTGFALFFPGLFPRFLGSAYAPSIAEQEAIFPIVHQNLQALTFPAGCFDYVLSNDVLEHVPDLRASLRECARILLPGGVLVATFPFAFNSDQTIQKATLEHGQVVNIMEPEYHGNPMRPAEGSLVFQIPGWSVIETARSEGFAYAYFLYISSQHHGILGGDLAGIFVFIAAK